MTYESSEGKERGRADQTGPYGRDVISLDQRALIRLRQRIAAGVGHIQVVIRIRCLEPGAAVAEVHVNRVSARNLVVHTIKQILLIALVVERVQFRRIQESAGVQSACGDEIPPFLPAEGDVETAGHRSKAPLGWFDGVN